MIKSMINSVLKVIRKMIPLSIQFRIGDSYSKTKFPGSLDYGKEFRKAWEEYQKSERYERTKLEMIQWEKFKVLLNYSYKNVPYYRKKYDEFGVKPKDVKEYSDLTKLPVIEKEEFKTNFESFIAEGIDPKKCNTKQTSGSTGAPTRILFDKRGEMAFPLIVRWYRNLAGAKPSDRWVFVRRRDFKSQKELENYTGEFNPLNNCLHFASQNLNDQIIAKYVQRLKKFQPKFIEGNSSDIYFIASYMKEKNDQISIPIVITRTDGLLDFHKKVISEVFKPTEIFNFYGNVEQVASGMDCLEHKGKHQNMLFNLVEVLDENGDQIFDKVGSIVGTNLENYATPLIRCRIGDLGAISKDKCPCGRQSWILKQIEGREGDVLLMPDGRKIAPGTIGSVPGIDLFGIKEYQLIQKSTDYIQVNVSLNESADESVGEKLKKNLIEFLKYDGKIEINYVKHIPRIANKFRVIISEITETKGD